MTEPNNISLEDIGRRWGVLLSQAFVQITALEQKLDQATQAQNALAMRVRDLEANLRQTELDSIAAQGKQIIDRK